MSFRFLTAGESHGKALIGILEGLPSGIPLSLEKLQLEMKRRKLGYGRGARQQIETDEIEILSGVRFGKTLGSPITLCIWNRDWENWKTTMASEPETETGLSPRAFSIPRPGHADYVGGKKYNHSDLRNVLERASARETATRVALGAICKQFCELFGITLGSHVVQIGTITTDLPFWPCSFPVSQLNSRVDNSPLRCLNPDAEKQGIQRIQEAQKKGDTLGGAFEVFAEGLPIGLGSYVQWDRRLDGKIGSAFLSLNAIKGVEIGQGIQVSQLQGSEAHDAYFLDDQEQLFQKTARSGGIDGGMSNGSPLKVRAYMKPLSTLQRPLPSVDLILKKLASAHVERSDVCAVPAAAVIGESLLALVLTELLLEKFGGDSLSEIQTRIEAWTALHPQPPSFFQK